MHAKEHTCALANSTVNSRNLDENLHHRNHFIRDQDGSDICAGAARQQNEQRKEPTQDMRHRKQCKI